MTYVSLLPGKLKDFKDIDIEDIYHENTAVGHESEAIEEAFKESVIHYLIPFSRQWEKPLIRFATLKNTWEKETSFLSSINDICMHPSYQQIIGMGPIAIPLILFEMKKEIGHWFWALKSITGDDPVLPEYRGKLREMTDAWLKWGESQGYV